MKKNTIAVSELSNLKMVTRNEKKFTYVIHNGMLKQWVGIGWIDVRKPTAKDKEMYLTAVYK